LELDDEHRQLISKGQLKKKGTGSESSDLHVFLLDRYLLIVKQKYMQKAEKYKLYRPVSVNWVLALDQYKMGTKQMQ
jgi:hypothetical protein